MLDRGLGLEFVRQISQDSSNTVIATTRSMSSDLSDLKKVSEPNGKNTHILECNTGDLESIKKFVSEVGSKLSGTKINYLLNNAGQNSVPDQTSLTIEPKDLMHEITVNVIGPAKTTQFLLEARLLAPDVRIMNMTSGLGSMKVSLGIEPRKCATYSISKAALNSLTVQQSGEVPKRLGGEAVVICMDPGWVKTRMGGEGAILEAEESVSLTMLCAA